MYPSKTILFRERAITYDGTQLAPHWIYRELDCLDNAIVAFLGPADVKLDHMVDLEDVKKKALIYSPLMLHFLGEWFIDSLEVGILLQHVFVGAVYERLLERGISELSRRGNDLYFRGRKLSVSIVTRSPVSVLLHFAINVRTEGTPVPTAGLAELRIDPWELADEVLSGFASDLDVMRKARVKVLPRD